MKNLISLLTILLFILNISLNNLFSAEANDGASPDPVLDAEGNELKTGTKYYVHSSFRPGDGVSIYPLANRTSTFAVTQLVFGQGLPVVFHNGGTDMGEVINVSTDLTIIFDPSLFWFPTAWKVDKYDVEEKNYFVVAGESGWDKDIVNNRFQIRKNPSLGDYRFVFCPSALICTDVGIYLSGDGVRRLALNPNFRSSTFWFKKAC